MKSSHPYMAILLLLTDTDCSPHWSPAAPLPPRIPYTMCSPSGKAVDPPPPPPPTTKMLLETLDGKG